MTAAQLAAIAFVRTSGCTVGLPMDEFEGEGDCPECYETVPVLLIPVDAETALAACMRCGERFNQYIGD
jgi:hypothetical protein